MLHLSAIYLPIYGMNNQIGLFSRVHPNTIRTQLLFGTAVGFPPRYPLYQIFLLVKFALSDTIRIMQGAGFEPANH